MVHTEDITEELVGCMGGDAGGIYLIECNQEVISHRDPTYHPKRLISLSLGDVCDVVVGYVV